MVVQKIANSSAYSVSVRDANQAKTVAPWLRKAGLIMSAVGLGALGVFGHAPAKPVLPSVNGRPPIVRNVSEFFGAKTAFAAEQALSNEGQINKEEALTLIGRPLQKQRAFTYALKDLKDLTPEEQKKLVGILGGQLYISQAYFGEYMGQPLAINLVSGSALCLGIKNGTYYLDLTPDFLKKDTVAETRSVWSKDVQYVVMDFGGQNKLPAVVIADKGENRLLIVTFEVLNEKDVGIGIRRIDLDFKISGNFSLSAVSAQEDPNYCTAFLYDEVNRTGTALLFDGGQTPPGQYLGNIIYYPIEGYAPKASDIKIVPYLANGKMRLIMADPTWIGDSEYVGNGLMKALSDIYLTDKTQASAGSKN
jgi:hypothetical protein